MVSEVNDLISTDKLTVGVLRVSILKPQSHLLTDSVRHRLLHEHCHAREHAGVWMQSRMRRGFMCTEPEVVLSVRKTNTYPVSGDQPCLPEASAHLFQPLGQEPVRR